MVGATLRKSNHGPVALVPTRFRTLIAGCGGFTVRLALAVLPAPAVVAETAPLVFAYVAAAAAVTVTDTVQLAPPASDPLPRLMLLPPAAAVTLPPQVLAIGGNGLALTSPAGYVSAKAIPLRVSLTLGLVIVNVSSDVPFT